MKKIVNLDAFEYLLSNAPVDGFTNILPTDGANDLDVNILVWLLLGETVIVVTQDPDISNRVLELQSILQMAWEGETLMGEMILPNEEEKAFLDILKPDRRLRQKKYYGPNLYVRLIEKEATDYQIKQAIQTYKPV